MSRLPFILFIGLPLLEIYGFVQMGDWLGTANSLLLLCTTSLFGWWLLQDRGGWQTLLLQWQNQQLSMQQLSGHLLGKLAALLLILPGFFTDLCGLLLLFPPVRQLISRQIQQRWPSQQSDIIEGETVQRTRHLPPKDD